MFDLIDSGNAPLTMTSREIAELTGKRHDNVMTDIRKMLDELGLDAPEFSGTYRTDRGNEYECFNLPHRECMILVSGYSIPMRARIVDRWEALETGKAKPAMVAQPYSAAVEAIQVADALAKMLRLEGSARLDVAQKAVKIRAPDLLPMVPVYAIDAPSGSGAGSSSEATASLSALMKANDIKGTAATMNVRLEMYGFLEKKTRAGQSGEKSFWSVTEAGQKYGKNLTSPQNQRETQPHWYRDKFLDLMSTINAK